MQCGGCDLTQTVPIVLNPATWLLALAAVTALVAKTSKREKK